MSLEQLLNLLACAALILFGIYSILRPRDAAALAHITPNDAIGSAEVRISFGGLSLMTGLVPFVLGDRLSIRPSASSTSVRWRHDC